MTDADLPATTAPRDNTITWWEIQVTDLAAARRFYGAVFGWTFTDMYEGFVLCHDAAGTMIGGLELSDGELGTRSVRIYGQTPNLEAALDRAVAAGGRVVRPRSLITEEFGWYAVVADPSGLQIGLATAFPPDPS